MTKNIAVFAAGPGASPLRGASAALFLCGLLVNLSLIKSTWNGVMEIGHRFARNLDARSGAADARDHLINRDYDIAHGQEPSPTAFFFSPVPPTQLPFFS